MIALGTEVRCKLTGFKGIAVSRTEYLYGCVRLGVQAKAPKEGKPPELEYFDEPQLEVTGKGIKTAEAYRHGPRPAPKGQVNPG